MGSRATSTGEQALALIPDFLLRRPTESRADQSARAINPPHPLRVPLGNADSQSESWRDIRLLVPSPAFPPPFIDHSTDQSWLPFEPSRQSLSRDYQELVHGLSDNVRMLGLQQSVVLLERERRHYPSPRDQMESSDPREQQPYLSNSIDDTQKRFWYLVSILGLQCALSVLQRERRKPAEIIDDGVPGQQIRSGRLVSFGNGNVPSMIVVPPNPPPFLELSNGNFDNVGSLVPDIGTMVLGGNEGDGVAKRKVGRGGLMKCDPCRKAHCPVCLSRLSALLTIVY
jgi:hypothetical protein